MPQDSRLPEGGPRFRILLEDGSELPISTVEGLARRLGRGEVLPDTPLYDAGTGGWERARDSRVVRFVLEEMEREGESSPPGWPVGWSEADPPAPPPAPDTTEFGFTLTEVSDEPAWPEPEEPEAPDPSDEPAGLEDWLTTTAAGGMIGRDESFSGGAGPIDPDPPARPPDRRTAAREPAAQGSRPGPAAALPFPGRSRTPTVLLLVGVAVGIAAAGVFLGDGWGGWGSGGAPGPAAGPGATGPVSTELPVPADLEGLVQPGLDHFAAAAQGAVDSLRGVHGLPGAPPADWLGGYYLANAGEFPEVRGFWERYGQLVAEMRLLEGAVFAAALEEALQPLAGDAGRAQRLDSYLRTRFGLAEPWRQERYEQLVLAAGHAVALHDFLGERQEDLRYTPALGPSMPRDPVLEVRAEDPEIRGELERHLDALFGALDRSRGGGPPSSAGLRAELFEGFGSF